MFKVTFMGEVNQRGCIGGKSLRPGESVEMTEVPPDLHGNPMFKVEEIAAAAPAQKPARVGGRIAEAPAPKEIKQPEPVKPAAPMEKPAEPKPAIETAPVEKSVVETAPAPKDEAAATEASPESAPSPAPEKRRRKK